jgi:hypothetical protein
LKKKLIISLSVVFGFVAVLLILFWTLFGLKTVTVSFSTTLEKLNVTEDEIVEAGQFRMGSCVLFEGKQKYIQNIEDYVSKNKDFAYIKVSNIETVFPNKFVIHISEREELFAVQNAGQTYICDRELKVLRIFDAYSSSQSNAIELEGLTIKNSEVDVGDFLEVDESGITKLYSAFVANNRNLNEQRAKFQKIEVEKYQDSFTKKEYQKIRLYTFSGRTFEIDNIDFALENKIRLMFSVETSLFSHDLDEDGNFVDSDGEIIYVKKLESGELVSFDAESDAEEEKIALSIEFISKCEIKVDNLTLSEYVSRTENDIYYSLVLTEEDLPAEQ